MSFTVYDDNKIALQTFESYAKAAQYVFNNDDIASFINDERVTPEVFIPTDLMPEAAPAQHAASKPVKTKLLTAEQAKQALKDKLSVEVEGIINTVLENNGHAEYLAPLHPLIGSMLYELGYSVKNVPDSDNLLVSIPLE